MKADSVVSVVEMPEPKSEVKPVPQVTPVVLMNSDTDDEDDEYEELFAREESAEFLDASALVEKKKNAPVKKATRVKTIKPITSYTVRDGESLWSIAARRSIYRDALLWPLLYQANRDQIKDPRQIFPGQELSVPRNKSLPELDDAREKARESTIFPLDILLKGRE